MKNTPDKKTVKHQIFSTKHKFESEDSEGSEISYDSSLSSQEDNFNAERIEFFRQQMARFFINYPELANRNLLKTDKKIPDQQQNKETQIGNHLSGALKNKHWQSIAGDILASAKESTTNLESLAKRISLYRYKIEQTDIVDLLLKQKNNIMKELDLEITQKVNDNGSNNSYTKEMIKENAFREDNTYLSWRKRKEMELKASNRFTKPIDNLANKSKSVQNFSKSLHKASTNSRYQKADSITPNFKPSAILTRAKSKNSRDGKNSLELVNEVKLDEPQMKPRQTNAAWKELANFQPRTEVGKQLVEQIRKNNPSDESAIKKTIMSFLVKNKETISNEVINKCTISQKMQKIYSDDAKQLLLFYPMQHNNTAKLHFKQSQCEEKFFNVLKDISEGPLMKYWRQMQENRF